jgi:hypothetical protein
MARAPVSKTGGWGFESLHSCHRLHCVSKVAQEVSGIARKLFGPPPVGRHRCTLAVPGAPERK